MTWVQPYDNLNYLLMIQSNESFKKDVDVSGVNCITLTFTCFFLGRGKTYGLFLKMYVH